MMSGRSVHNLSHLQFGVTLLVNYSGQPSLFQSTQCCHLQIVQLSYPVSSSHPLISHKMTSLNQSLSHWSRHDATMQSPSYGTSQANIQKLQHIQNCLDKRFLQNPYISSSAALKSFHCPPSRVTYISSMHAYLLDRRYGSIVISILFVIQRDLCLSASNSRTV